MNDAPVVSKNRELTSDEAAELGITTSHNQMANGEYRFRLRALDGCAYIRTEAVQNPGSLQESWQNSHVHEKVLETYIVQSGRMVLIELLPGDLVQTRVFESDAIVTTRPGIPHNVFLFPGSVIHTVKHGPETRGDDREPYPRLDEITVGLPMTVQQILELDGTSQPFDALARQLRRA